MESTLQDFFKCRDTKYCFTIYNISILVAQIRSRFLSLIYWISYHNFTHATFFESIMQFSRLIALCLLAFPLIFELQNNFFYMRNNILIPMQKITKNCCCYRYLGDATSVECEPHGQNPLKPE